MIIDKIFYKTLFKNLFSDTFELKLWDGTSEIYGEGEVQFKINFNEPIPKADIIKDPSLTLGEAYMTKKIDIEGSIQKVIESLYNNKESFLSNSDKYADLLKMAINNLLNDNGVSLLHCITGIQFLFNKGVNNDFQWTRDYMYK